MAAKFVLKRSTNGKYHFNLQAANGEIIATSELYESKTSAQKGIESVRLNAPRAALDDQSEQTAPKPQAPAKPQAPPKPQTTARPQAPAKPQAAPKPQPPAGSQAAPKPQVPAKP
jgi:uncharacterized protein YegP (UPF0339 family)